eukprot:TRINITY_DN108489_c0_g1_i1.p1 TRINITY_DN108489_c0_g1~~TRINITY_DN108489_c0_g1_i1.p1  ORF type:complete len:283 (-),score=52.94 TRINITY_DN108489_c0_g1_i1:70-852(-)
MANVEHHTQDRREPSTRSSSIDLQASSRRGSKLVTGGRKGSKEGRQSIHWQGPITVVDTEPQVSSRHGSKQATGSRSGSKASTVATPRQGGNTAAGAAARLLLGMPSMPSEAETGASPKVDIAGSQIQQIACRGTNSPDSHQESGHQAGEDDRETPINAVAAKMQRLAAMARKLDSELPVQEAQRLKIQQLRLMLEEFEQPMLQNNMKERFDAHFKTLGCLVGANPKVFNPQFDRAVATVISVFKSSASTSMVFQASQPM